MNIFHVIYVAGRVAAAIYVGDATDAHRDLCRRMDAGMSDIFDQEFDGRSVDDPALRLDGRRLTRADFTSRCEEREEPPTLDPEAQAQE